MKILIALSVSYYVCHLLHFEQYIVFRLSPCIFASAARLRLL